jgi:hypothetical protein
VCLPEEIGSVTVAAEVQPSLDGNPGTAHFVVDKAAAGSLTDRTMLSFQMRFLWNYRRLLQILLPGAGRSSKNYQQHCHRKGSSFDLLNRELALDLLDFFGSEDSVMVDVSPLHERCCSKALPKIV